MRSSSEAFFARLPAFAGFRGVLDDAHYVPVPQDWSLAVADVVGSTAAIRAGRYREVNFAGAAVICAVQNAAGSRAMPFAFGGDGAVLPIAPDEADGVREALARTRGWTAAALDLELRTALIPVAAVRAAGHDVRLGRHAVGGTGYAMFAGGGVRWADAELKAGRYTVAPAPAGAEPDLSGLSCRWMPVRSRRGVMLSLIVEPRPASDPDAFRALIAALLETLAGEEREGHPLPAAGPGAPRPLHGTRLELRATRRPRTWAAEQTLAWLSAAARRPVRGFSTTSYRADVAANADFRKFDDALKLTVDVAPATAERLEALLARAARDGTCRHGVHRQQEALITCIIPSMRERDHVHFIDGASGGYALAAAAMKADGNDEGPAAAGPSGS
jgi:hypothetical protein